MAISPSSREPRAIRRCYVHAVRASGGRGRSRCAGVCRRDDGARHRRFGGRVPAPIRPDSRQRVRGRGRLARRQSDSMAFFPRWSPSVRERSVCAWRSARATHTWPVRSSPGASTQLLEGWPSAWLATLWLSPMLQTLLFNVPGARWDDTCGRRRLALCARVRRFRHPGTPRGPDRSGPGVAAGVGARWRSRGQRPWTVFQFGVACSCALPLTACRKAA